MLVFNRGETMSNVDNAKQEFQAMLDDAKKLYPNVPAFLLEVALKCAMKEEETGECPLKSNDDVEEEYLRKPVEAEYIPQFIVRDV